MSSILQSIKVNAAIGNSTVSNATIYTAPATGYALVQIEVSAGSTSVSVTVGGQGIVEGSTGGTVFGVVVGPSAAVAKSAGTGTVRISGVEFINTN